MLRWLREMQLKFTFAFLIWKTIFIAILLFLGIIAIAPRLKPCVHGSQQQVCAK